MHTTTGFDYVIGDVQGCYASLQHLLTVLPFNAQHDRLWFVGDLVNRGPRSLEVLRFIRALPQAPRITLGNHDLHLLDLIFNPQAQQMPEDTLDEILNAPDKEAIGHWLRQQNIIYWDAEQHVVMSHAGIAPLWTFDEALMYGRELEVVLQRDDFIVFLEHMRERMPDKWSYDLAGQARWRLICHYFTRMRYCHADGRLAPGYKKDLQHASKDLYPWFALPNRPEIDADIVFGHWAALDGECPHPHIAAIDTGCVWGRTLTALRLQDRKRFSVTAQE